MAQLDYSVSATAAVQGSLADSGPHTAVSLSTPASGIVYFGNAVSYSTTAGLAKLPAASADVTSLLAGFALSTHAFESSASGDPQYAVSEAASLLTNGRIWCKVEEAVAIGDPVFVRYASGAGGTVLGAIRKSADTATAAQAPGCRFISAASANGLALVQVNLP